MILKKQVHQNQKTIREKDGNFFDFVRYYIYKYACRR